MAVTNSSLQTAFTPEDYGKLIDTVIAAKSVAFQVSTIVQTGSETIRFPKITADGATGWYAENTQISLTDPTTAELVVTPKKVAGLTQISTEAAEDSNPAVAQQVGNSIARSIAKKIDAAFFGNTVTNGPNGLLSLTTSEVDTDTYAFTSLDPFHVAKNTALTAGSNLTHFVISPDVALALATTKELSSGSNKGLLDATGISDGTLVAGLPVLVSTDVAAGSAWGIDSSQVYSVQRTGTKVTTSTDAAFDYDAVQVRGTARVSFGFALPLGIVHIFDTA